MALTGIRRDGPALKAARMGLGACLLASLVLQGCGDGAPSPAAGARDRPAAPPVAQAPEPAAASVEVVAPLWVAARGAESVSLTLTDETRGPEVVLRMTCGADRSFALESERLRHVESEERLTVGVGATVLTMVATAIPGQAGVRASGPLGGGILDDILVGNVLNANYGNQNLGPLPSAERPLLARFVLACRSFARG